MNLDVSVFITGLMKIIFSPIMAVINTATKPKMDSIMTALRGGRRLLRLSSHAPSLALAAGR